MYESYFKKGSEAIYKGLTPTKPSITIGTETMNYTFAGWDKDTSSVEGFTTFTALFTSPKYL